MFVLIVGVKMQKPGTIYGVPGFCFYSCGHNYSLFTTLVKVVVLPVPMLKV